MFQRWRNILMILPTLGFNSKDQWKYQDPDNLHHHVSDQNCYWICSHNNIVMMFNVLVIFSLLKVIFYNLAGIMPTKRCLVKCCKIKEAAKQIFRIPELNVVGQEILNVWLDTIDQSRKNSGDLGICAKHFSGIFSVLRFFFKIPHL